MTPIKIMKYFLFVVIFLSNNTAQSQNDVSINKVKNTPNFIELEKKILEIESVDLAKVNVEKTIKEMRSPGLDINNSAATLLLILEGAIHHFPIDIDDTSYGHRSEDKVISKNIIISSKKYLLMLAEKHPRKRVQQAAYCALSRVFLEDKEVVFWSMDQLFKSDISPDFYSYILQTLILTSGNKYKDFAVLATRRGLTSKIDSQKGQTLIAIHKSSFYNKEILNDLITVALVEKDKRLIRVLSQLLKRYEIKEINKHYDLVKYIAEKKANEKYMKEFINFFSWLKDKK